MVCSNGTMWTTKARVLPCALIYSAQVAERRAGRKIIVTAGGGSGLPEAHAFGWRDAMDLPVKWRQLSEPNDQV